MLLLLAAIGLGGCANEVTDTLIERPLGAISELMVNLQYPMEKDPLLQGYVFQIGEQQRELRGRRNVPYRYKVVAIEAPNAFAIPWGGIYVTRGLLRFADSEDEIAFVLAHEMGHVERRHSSRAFQRNLLVGIGLDLITSNNNQNWMQYAYIANRLLDLHFTRESEYAADHEGVRLALASGYDPERGEEFFVRLDDRYGRVPRFFSYLQTHPINRDRVTRMRREPGMALDDPRPLTAIAQGYLDRGRYTSAEAHFRQAIAADPEFGDAHLGLARIARWRGERGLAREQYLEAMRRGADTQVVNAELATVEPSQSVPQPAPTVRLAGTREVDEVKVALLQSAGSLERVTELGQKVWNVPFDSREDLRQGYDRSGELLNAIYQIGMPVTDQAREILSIGQSVQGLALRTAAEVAAAQEWAQHTTELLAENRRRIEARLAKEPSAEAVALAQAVVLDTQRAARDLELSLERLNEVQPVAEEVLEESYAAIQELHRATVQQGRRLPPAAMAAVVENARRDNEQVFERIDEYSRGVYRGRTRALQSSIDITLLDQPFHVREAARRIVARFMLSNEPQVENLVDVGHSYGESAYVLGMAKSANDEVAEVEQMIRDAEVRGTVDRLSRRSAGRTGNVSIMLSLIDKTLKQEFDPLYTPDDPEVERQERVDLLVR